MEFMLDFQGFKNAKNEYIIKELAIISTDEQVYELNLFRPPCDFNTLPHEVRKQVIWLEKYFHGLFWNSGFKGFNELQDVMKSVFRFGGKIYVKGMEKCVFIRELLSDIDVIVVNLEDLDCPNLDVLKRQTQHSKLKNCPFNHISEHCAYRNVQMLLEWWKLKNILSDKMDKVNLAMKECASKGYKHMCSDLIEHLPKYFIMSYHGDIEDVYEKLPKTLKEDEEIKNCLRCGKHYDWRGDINSDCWDGKNPKRKNCFFCKAESGLFNLSS